jgi:large exoprotein involved in heme utilization and adhesion
VAADPANPDLPPATSTTRAGNIDLQVDTLTLAGTAQISTQSENAGQAGIIAIAAADALTINSPAGALQSGVYSTAAGSGSGGSISISGGRFVMQGGAVNVSAAGGGDAGSVSVVTESLQMSNGAQISTATSGTGNGGSLQVQTTGSTRLAGTASDSFRTGLYSQALGSGTGGDVQVSAVSVGLSNNAVISAESLGTGDAGKIDINAASEVTLDNASITTEAVIADGGNININASYQVYLLNSEVTTSVGTGFGDGGNITIDPEFVVLNNSLILANAYGGDGGNITIVTDHFVSSANSLIDASSQLGINGTINIITPDEEVTSNIEELPVAYLDATGLLRERCSARRFSDRSSFTMGGRQGVPLAPAGMSTLSSSISDSLNARYAAHAPGTISTGPLLQPTLSQGMLLPAAYLAAGLWGCSG